jgi:hypothetical protein
LLCSPHSCKSLVATPRPCDDPTHLWKQAEEKELSALFKMRTFSEKIFIDDMTPAQRRLLLSTRWVYRYKTVDDQVTCKARLVARGDEHS